MSEPIDHFSSARAMRDAVRAKEVSARELLELHLDRIEQTNPRVNAIVSADPERARAAAAQADEQLARGEDVGPLHGLPFAVKDTHEVGGWLSTSGSPVRADHVPERDELLVERVRAAGAITVGKTNTPEFASGSHTFNPLFGTTYNPYDLSRSAGGSSGGSAAALASGMVPLADGSDMGGSLRNPASFCNVVGMRPSFQRVPQWPNPNHWEAISVQGPLARSVDDLALLLSVMAGPTERVPISQQAPGEVFDVIDPIDLGDLRIAMSIDLGGAFEVDADVAAIVRAQGEALEQAGARVAETAPDLREAEDTFRTLRAWHFQASYGQLLAEHPGKFKESLADNIRAGEALTGADIARGYRQRSTLAERMRLFFQEYDALVLPVSQVPPFPADQEYPADINGQVQETYLDWMRSAFLITVTGCPAMSVPAGFTAQGWPVGLQIVTSANSERRLLSIAHAYERLTNVGARRPTL
ncbi:amidase [Janibacter cremeus]|uniref:Amidase n=1 Tax=Janibacter cremeus TaxID=1285192 RepID=A0A852VPU4_9MICO|nr:amidase [Janibacter cremeus]NYF97919.1 amidase [Janibacter cremeus]